MYSEAMVRILSSFNICLQEVTRLAPAIHLITLFEFWVSLKLIHLLNAPSMIYQTEEVSGILQSKCFGSSTDLDFP
jgi:hypothetical protein